MSVEYYMFLDEIRMISGQIVNLQESINEKVLKSLLFMEDLNTHLASIDNLLIRCIKNENKKR